MTSKFKILRGLSGTGPEAILFSPDGQGAHREGLVVEFDSNYKSWIGNFQPGLSKSDAVCMHPNGTGVIVISGGQGYIVNPEDPAFKYFFGGDIQDVVEIPEYKSIAFGNGLWFEFIGKDWEIWCTTRRISWDGMQDLKKNGDQIIGMAWQPGEDAWVPFELNVLTGEVEGGSYPTHLP